MINAVRVCKKITCTVLLPGNPEGFENPQGL